MLDKTQVSQRQVTVKHKDRHKTDTSQRQVRTNQGQVETSLAQDTLDKLDTRLTQVNRDKVDMTQFRNKLWTIHWQVNTLDADKLIDTSLS